MANKRAELLYAIQMYDFYLYELQLYLDTHSNCPNALNAFKRYKELRQKTVNAYVEMFGPITPIQSECSNVFEWVQGPWPWEKEAN